MRRTRSITKLLVAALLLAQYVGWNPFDKASLPRVEARSQGARQKLSNDFFDAMAGRDPQERVRVIVQSSGEMGELVSAIKRVGGVVRREYANLNHVAVEVPASAVTALAGRSDVDFVSEDRTIEVTGHLETTTGAALARAYIAKQKGEVDGSGIGIAVLDSGIYTGHHAFKKSRVVASVDFTGEDRTDDPFGHGTHVASIAVGDSHIAGGAYTGIAPGANLINVRVLDSQGRGSTSNAIAAIDWCISAKAIYNIRVLNLSFGAIAVDSYVNDPLCQAVRRAFDAGLVVCVAAGNLGKDQAGNKIYGAIHSPGIEPSAITVGASNTLGTDSRSDDVITTYSSRGPTRGFVTDSEGVRHYDNIIKPDLVAPGNRIIDAQSPDNQLISTTPSLDAGVSDYLKHRMMYMSGTSMATPIVAGAAALLLQRNPSLTPNLVKAILEYTAQPLAGANTLEQGAGQINVEGAVRLAGLVRRDLKRLKLGEPLLAGSLPEQSTTIADATFAWGGGLIQKWNLIYGDELIAKYQGIYGAGTLLTNGVLLTNGTLLANGTLLSAGTLISTGTILSDGTILCSGTLLTSGTVLADGTLLNDGTLLVDGTLMSDSLLAASMGKAVADGIALAARTGDSTLSMPPIIDAGKD
jgi:serine protease AprX